MISRNTITKTARLLAAIAAVGTASVSEAITSYKVSLDTSSLVGNPSAPFYLDFLLIDGSGLDDGNNTVTVSDFQFGGGNAVGSATATGGASGDLASGITLVDTEFFNDIYQEFAPGSWLSFLVSLTGNVDSGGTPDLFSFSILDSDLFAIPTEAFDWSDSLLEITLDGSATSIEAYAGVDGFDGIGAPNVSAVPEGSTYGICFVSMFALFIAKRKLEGQSALRSA